MTAHPRFRLILTSVAASAFLAACNGSGLTHTDHAFSTHAFVTSAAGIDEDAVVRNAIDQILARGREAGLVLEETSDRHVRLVSTTATPGGDASPDAGTIDDTRRVIASAEFRTTRAGIRYDYSVTLRGAQPKNTTPAHERNVVAGLFMVREVFERPLDVDLDALRGVQ